MSRDPSFVADDAAVPDDAPCQAAEVPWHVVVETSPKILLGPLPRSYAAIPATVFVNVCGVAVPGATDSQAVHEWSLVDSQSRRLVPDRSAVEGFLARVHGDACRADTYWHCRAGINRSGFVLAAYLHLYAGLRISQAIALLRDRRSPMVLCNAAFERVLRDWYGEPDEQAFEAVSYETWRAEVEKHRSGR